MGLKNSNWITAGVMPTDGMVLVYDAANTEGRMRSLTMALSAAATQPAVGGSVNVTLSFVAGLAPGLTAYIANVVTGQPHGYYNIDSVNGATRVVGLTRLQHTGTSTATGGTLAANTSILTTGGRPGADGGTGSTGAPGQNAVQPLATISDARTQPAIGGSTSFLVDSTAGLTLNGVVTIYLGTTYYGTYRITFIAAGSVSATNLGSAGLTVPATIPAGAVISLKGEPGQRGGDGINGTNGTSAPATIGTTTSAMAPSAVGNTGLVSLNAGTAAITFVQTGHVLSVSDSAGLFLGSIRVTAVDGATFVLNYEYLGRGGVGPIVSMPSGSVLRIGGVPGPVGQTGANGNPSIQQLWNGVGPNIYKLICVLPAPSAGTYDAAVIEGVLGDYQWEGKSGIRIEMSNRAQGFGFRWWDFGGGNVTLGIQARRKADNTVDVWAYSTSGVGASLLAVMVQQGGISATPDASFSVGSVTGTIILDTLNRATYPPVNTLSTAVRGRTDATRSGYVTTLIQDLPSGFHSINVPAGQASALNMPEDGWYYVLINHHENNSSFSDVWRAESVFKLASGRRWYREVRRENGNVVYTPWQRDYLHPYAMPQATFDNRDVWATFVNRSNGDLQYATLGALKGMLALSTSQIPNQGGVPN